MSPLFMLAAGWQQLRTALVCQVDGGDLHVLLEKSSMKDTTQMIENSSVVW